MSIIRLPFSQMASIGNDIITQTNQLQSNTAEPLNQFMAAASSVMGNAHDDAVTFAQHLQGALQVLLEHRIFVGKNLSQIGDAGVRVETSLVGQENAQ